MKNVVNSTRFPDLFSRPSAHRFQGHWDSVAVSRIIRDHSTAQRSPSFLFLGREEAALLARHLTQAFGEDSITPDLNDIYYMGLRVIIVDAAQYISTGGAKDTRTNQAPGFLRAS